MPGPSCSGYVEEGGFPMLCLLLHALQDDQRTRRDGDDIVRSVGAWPRRERAVRQAACRVDDHRPPGAVLRAGQANVKITVVRVEAQQKRIVVDPLAARVDLVDFPAVEKDDDTAPETTVPILL